MAKRLRAILIRTANAAQVGTPKINPSIGHIGISPAMRMKKITQTVGLSAGSRFFGFDV